LNEIIEKLEDYIYIDEIPDIKYGSYLRWIPLKDFNNIKLTNGAIICDIIVSEKGTYILCKNNYGKCMKIKMDDSLLFRKLTYQEKILLNVVDHLNNN
jgi:hypothetical protein